MSENVVLKFGKIMSYENSSGLYAILKQKSKQLFWVELSEKEGLLSENAEERAFVGLRKAENLSEKGQF